MTSIESVGINKVQVPQIKTQESKAETKTQAPEAKPVTASADEAAGNYGKALLGLGAPCAKNTISKSYMEGNKFILEYADGTKKCLGAV